PVAIARAGERIYGDRAQPLVHVDLRDNLRVEGAAGKLHRLGKLDHPVIIIAFFIVFDEEGPAIAFFTVSQIANRGAEHVVRKGHLVAFRGTSVCTVKLIDQFIFEYGAIATMVELVIEENITIPRELKFSRTGVFRA